MKAIPKVRFNLDVTQEVADFLESLATEQGTTKSEVMRRALALLKVAHEERSRGRSLGFVSKEKDSVLETRVVGIP